MLRHRTTARRLAFTLVEMLVVIALILILMTIAAAMFPRFAESQRVLKGADQLSGLLLNAKQRALRDRTATGIRITSLSEVVYIQQPNDFSGGRIEGSLPGGRVAFNGVDLTGGHGIGPLSAVQPGDYLEINGGGLVRQIKQVFSNNLLSVIDWEPGNTTRPVPAGPYRIIRMPRPVPGEAPVQLPANIIIDLTDNQPNPLNNRSQNVPQRTVVGDPQPIFEILFAPGGGVVGQGTNTGQNIILWVRDSTKDNAAMEGSPLLVSIHTRTGMIAVHPVNTADPANRYQFTRDGRSSGL